MNAVTSTNILFERKKGGFIPVEKSMEICAGAGYKELDLCFVDLVTAGTEFCRDSWKEYVCGLGRLAVQKGVSFVQAHAPIHDFCRDQEGAGNALLVRRSIEGAGLLGIPWIVLHPSTGVEQGSISPDTHQRNVMYIRELADYARQLHVGIAVENMWGTTREGVRRYAIGAEELKALIDDVDRSNAGVCWDTEHGSIEGLDQPEALHLLKGYIRATHISDQTAHDNIHILPYTGFTDWDQVLGAFADIDYKGVFAFEIQHYLMDMPEELWPEAVRFSRAVGEAMMKKIRKEKE